MNEDEILQLIARKLRIEPYIEETMSGTRLHVKVKLGDIEVDDDFVYLPSND